MSENPLRSWRKSKGLRAVDVANQIGVSERSILAFELGAFSPSTETVEKLSKLMEDDAKRIKLMFTVWKRGKRAKSS